MMSLMKDYDGVMFRLWKTLGNVIDVCLDTPLSSIIPLRLISKPM